MKVNSVNIGSPQTIQQGNRAVTTAISKAPQHERATVGDLGLVKDSICDYRFHGGPDQAVYLYRQEDYEWWQQELGRAITPGTFGENLTITGISEATLFIGDVINFTDLSLQITAPRIPCATFAATMGDTGFVKQFLRAERPGFYCRVLKNGTIGVNDEGVLVPYAQASILTTKLYRDLQRKLNRSELEAYLALPIDIRSRTAFQKSLKALTNEGN
jgi:MOSC domain-containing protein YiiM